MRTPLYKIGQVINYQGNPIKITDMVKVEYTIKGFSYYYYSYEFVKQTAVTKKWSVQKKINSEYEIKILSL